MQKIKDTVFAIMNAKPTTYSHSLILNVLGMHIYRTFFFYLWRLARIPYRVPTEYRDMLRTLKRDGILVIPDFFPADLYEKIKAEYLALEPKFAPNPSPIPLPHTDGINLHDSQVSPFFRNSFTENAAIRELTRGYLNRKFHLPMHAALKKMYCLNEEEIKSPKNGGTNNLHFDIPARLMKGFFYVTDTNIPNAALKYCVGTNKRNSFKRLLYEYQLSVRYALNKGNPSHNGEYKDGEPWVKLTPEEQVRHHIIEKDFEVKGNTLVLMDAGAFHRRGEFLSTIPRRTVEINFRSIDTLRNTLFPLEKLFLKK
jgi:hypothetical protein